MFGHRRRHTRLSQQTALDLLVAHTLSHPEMFERFGVMLTEGGADLGEFDFLSLMAAFLTAVNEQASLCLGCDPNAAEAANWPIDVPRALMASGSHNHL